MRAIEHWFLVVSRRGALKADEDPTNAYGYAEAWRGHDVLAADVEAGWESTHLLLGFAIGFLFLPRLHAARLGHLRPFRALLSAAESVPRWGPQRQPEASC